MSVLRGSWGPGLLGTLIFVLKPCKCTGEGEGKEERGKAGLPLSLVQLLKS